VIAKCLEEIFSNVAEMTQFATEADLGREADFYKKHKKRIFGIKKANSLMDGCGEIPRCFN
jgi:hypothetical protein